jgi:hypothetical protein
MTGKFKAQGSKIKGSAKVQEFQCGPRVARKMVGIADPSRALEAFREGAENSARGGRAPRITLLSDSHWIFP